MNFKDCVSSPSLNAPKVPVGHIVVNSNWRGSEFLSVLQSSVKCIVEDNLEIVDCYPSCQIAVVIVLEGELACGGKVYGRKLVKLRKISGVSGMVLAERTPTTEQYFSALQKFAVLELGLQLLPLASLNEIAHYLVQLVHVESNPGKNPFSRQKTATSFVDQFVLTCLQSVPHLGDVKARALLDRFGSLQAICNATEDELSKVTGKASAVQIKSFFCKPISRIS